MVAAPIDTSERFYAYIRQLPLDLYSALAQIGRLSHHGFTAGISPAQDPRFRQWDLAFLAKSLLLYASAKGQIPLDNNTLFRCLQLINEIPDPVQETENSAYRTFVRVAYQQFGHQRTVKYLLARALYLFDIIPSEDFSRNPFDIKQRFLLMSGLSIKDFLAIGYVIWAATTHMNNLYFTPTVLPMGPEFSGEPYGQLPKLLTPQNVTAFLEYVSIDRTTFIQNSEDAHLEMGSAYDRYQWNPLYRYPLIRLPHNQDLLAGSYAVPLPPILLERVTNGLYWDFTQQYQVEREEFAALFGKIFENYVGRLLNYHFEHVIPEVPVGARSCDYILVEGESAVLIECKTKRITLESRITGDVAKIAADLVPGAAKGLCTIARTRRDLKSSALPLDGLEAVNAFYHIVLFVDDYHFGNSHWTRRLIEDAIATSQVYNCAVDDIQDLRYHIMSVYELEMYLPALQAYGFAAMLQKKEEREIDYHSDFSNFLPNYIDGSLENGMLQPVSNNLITSLGPEANA